MGSSPAQPIYPAILLTRAPPATPRTLKSRFVRLVLLRRLVRLFVRETSPSPPTQIRAALGLSSTLLGALRFPATVGRSSFCRPQARSSRQARRIRLVSRRQRVAGLVALPLR